VTRPRLLVVTTVHRPDDPRIRAKLIPTLAAEWDVAYATKLPGPSDSTGLTWLPLPGGRVRRWWRAGTLIWQKRWSLVAIHDPELLLAGWVRSLLGRATLFDLHENLPSQLLTREWIPRPLRRPLSWISVRILRLAESSMEITLAEPGYRRLFRRDHPVIANHLPPVLPAPGPPASPPFLAYLGDITQTRGAYLALEAAAGAGHRLVMIGRIAPSELGATLATEAERLGVELELAGEMPHAEALQRVVGATGGLSPLLDIGNYRHSLPTKVPEYLALGLPVLASDLPGTSDPVAGLEGVTLVVPGNREAWRRAGGDLAEDHLERRRLVAGQAAEVRRRFTWSSDEVLSAYRRAGRL
jgi:glycosyltransferase involved in cell wall biosynthesis